MKTFSEYELVAIDILLEAGFVYEEFDSVTAVNKWVGDIRSVIDGEIIRRGSREARREHHWYIMKTPLIRMDLTCSRIDTETLFSNLDNEWPLAVIVYSDVYRRTYESLGISEPRSSTVVSDIGTALPIVFLE